jgi:AhpD family alkylhydroperoxidase
MRAVVSISLLIAVLCSGVSASEPFSEEERLYLPVVPNYLKALSKLEGTAKPFSNLIHSVIYKGEVRPEIKIQMGLSIARALKSEYVSAHMQRLLGKKSSPHSQTRLEVEYAEILTRDVNGISDTKFQQLSSVYNDSQLVELTMTVCFFNYFVRLASALNLPVEKQAMDEISAPAKEFRGPVARIALITDDEIIATNNALSASKNNTGGLGLGMANSQRAMLRSPLIGMAWRNYMQAVRSHDTVGREMKLHVSFAVSMANGCRYCTVHQVVGLRRLGIDPAKLVAMKKDDRALSAREKIAVEFARKLTLRPSTVSDNDVSRLKSEFGEKGALELILQTCTFSFMNRFTDSLRLPSEDEAIRVYTEVYGKN